MDFSVIIATYKREEELLANINSIISQKGISFEILIIEQGNTPKSSIANLVKSNSNLISHYFQIKPSLTEARNLGIKNSKGDLIAFFDDDVELSTDTLICYKDKFKRNPKISGASSFVIDPFYNGENKDVVRIDFKKIKFYPDFANTKEQDITSIPGMNMVFRRGIFNNGFSFDIRYKGNALWEEVDLSTELIKQNHKLRYFPDIKVTHKRVEKGGCYSGNSKNHIFWRYHNNMLFYLKHSTFKNIKSFLMEQKNSLEYFSRKKNKSSRKNRNYIFVVYGIFGLFVAVYSWIFKPKGRI